MFRRVISAKTFGMKLVFLVMGVAAIAFADLGNEGGHSGDPLEHDFLRRAAFVESELKATNFDSALLAVYSTALKELRAEVVDESLPTTGRVVPDPKRPGKRHVKLDRKKYGYCVEHRKEIDVSVFVAHEVWQTKEVDIDRSVTRELHFSEERFEKWKLGGAGTPKTEGPPPKDSADWVFVGEYLFEDMCKSYALREYRWFRWEGKPNNIYVNYPCFGAGPRKKPSDLASPSGNQIVNNSGVVVITGPNSTVTVPPVTSGSRPQPASASSLDVRPPDDSPEWELVSSTSQEDTCRLYVVGDFRWWRWERTSPANQFTQGWGRCYGAGRVVRPFYSGYGGY